MLKPTYADYKQSIDALNNTFRERPPREIIHFFLQNYGGTVGFATSMGAEDQVLTEMIAEIDKQAFIFTLDTGRMFPETYDLIHRTEQRYDIRISLYYPEAGMVEEMVAEKGINLFYESIENRKRCCHVRKIVPLQRALQGLNAWICGLRREQSLTRDDISFVAWDEANSMLKVSPLANWTEDQVWQYIHDKKIPYNPLHDQGFASIGCQPCTRAILPGEDVRAGRWWWEDPQSRECGLHKE